MPTVWIPALMRDLTAGQQTVQVAGATVREIIDNLDAAYPGTKAKLIQGESRRWLAVFVDAEIVRDGLDHPVADTSEVHFIAAIGGG